MKMQPTPSNSQAARLKRWINESLFNSSDAREYFEPLVNALSPRISLRGYKATVRAIHRETHDTVTFDLQPHGGWTGFRAGQHVDIEVDINGRRLTRTFSIASSPRHWLETGIVQLTIKRNNSGKVSRWLHENAKSGLVVGISQARGDFLLQSAPASHVLYLAAGSGLTPVMSHLRDMATPPGGRTATLLYYSRTPADTLFAGELRAIADAHPGIQIHIIHTSDSLSASDMAAPYPGDSCTSRPVLSGRVSDTHLTSVLGGLRPEQVMACGPLGFVDAARVAVADAGMAGIVFISEAFGGNRVVTSGEGHHHQVNFSTSGKQVNGSDRVTLLDLAEDHGLRPTAGCRMGICHTCKCTKVSGKVRNILTQEVSDEENESIQLCVSVPESDLTLSA